MKYWYFYCVCCDVDVLSLVRDEEAGYIPEHEDGVQTDRYTLRQRLKSEFGPAGGVAKLFDGDPPMVICWPESSDEEAVVVLPSEAAEKMEA